MLLFRRFCRWSGCSAVNISALTGFRLARLGSFIHVARNFNALKSSSLTRALIKSTNTSNTLMWCAFSQCRILQRRSTFIGHNWRCSARPFQIRIHHSSFTAEAASEFSAAAASIADPGALSLVQLGSQGVDGWWAGNRSWLRWAKGIPIVDLWLEFRLYVNLYIHLIQVYLAFF